MWALDIYRVFTWSSQSPGLACSVLHAYLFLLYSPAAHCGLLHDLTVFPGADWCPPAGQGGLPLSRPRAQHAVHRDRRRAHPPAHAAQPGLCRTCCLREYHTSVMPAQLWCAECQRWDRREMHREKKKKIMDGCCMENFISELRKPFSVFDSKPHTMTMAACMNGIERNKHGAWTNYTSSYFSSLTETPKLNKTKFMFLFSVDPILHLRM